MISTRVPPAVVYQKVGGAERGKYLLSVGYRKMRALNHTLPASCWTLIVRARMSGVSEISEGLTNYGISCHPETGKFGEFRILPWRSWLELSHSSQRSQPKMSTSFATL